MKNKKTKLGAFALLILGALAGSAQALLGGRSLCVAANTYDAAVETSECAINRTNDVAVTTRHLLWGFGAAAGSVKLATASVVPLGTIDNVESSTGQNMTVLLLGKGSTKKMVASEAITYGEHVYATAGGKVSDLPGTTGTYYCVGIALTAAGADGDIIEVQDCVPFAQVVA
jgi:hypothetical protein